MRRFLLTAIIVTLGCHKSESNQPPKPQPSTTTEATAQATNTESEGVVSPAQEVQIDDPASGIAIDPQRFIAARARATESAPGQLLFFSLHVRNMPLDAEFQGTVT